MATITLTLPVTGTIVTAGLHSSNYGTIQTVINGGLDNNNFATGKIFDPSKLMQDAATNGQGLVWNGSQWAPVYPPGYEFAYVQITSTVNVTATTEAAANSVVSAGSVTFDGSTVVMVEFFSPAVQKGTTWIRFALYEDGSSIGVLTPQLTPGGGTVGSTVVLKRRITPASGAHTFAVAAWVDGGTGEVFGASGGAGSFVPGYIRITKAA